MIAGRYFNPAGRNISGQLSDALNALSNRQSQAVSRDAAQQQMAIMDEERRKQALIEDFTQIKSLLEAGETEQAKTVARRRVEVLSDNGLDPSHSLDLISRIQTDPDSALRGVNAVLARGAASGYGPKTTALPADIQRFNYLTEIVNNPDNYPEATVRAAEVELGDRARAGTLSTVERVAASPETTEQVAESQAQIEGAKSEARETAKGFSQSKWKPQLEAAVVKAKQKAKSEGEALSNVAAMEAQLPILMETVAEIKELIPAATYTTKGKIWNAIVKEAGFGSTAGATARARLEALADNVILPLLRQTFGAAFTAPEGERLRATLVDEDATPEEKNAQVDVFIENKIRQIRAGRAEAGLSEEPEDPLGIR